MLQNLQGRGVPFPELIAPFVESASELLRARWEAVAGSALSEAFPRFDLLDSGVWIADDLSAVLGPALLSRFNRLRPLRAQSFPALFDTTEYYQRFVSEGRHPDRNDPTADVPIARKIAFRIADQFASQVALLLHRLVADDGVISQKLRIASPTANLIEIRYGLSDRHNCGATVCSLRFSDGNRLIYKPRPVRCEDLFYRVVDIVSRDLRVRLTCEPLTILDQNEYGWCNELETGQAISQTAAARFYYRAGILCACAHALALTDCHDGNLLASGEHPYVIDCETLGHPEPAIFLGEFGSVEEAFRAGVVRTGFLPNWKRGGPDAADALDAAALADSRHIAWRSLRLSWHGLGTDGLTATAHRSYAKASANLPLGADGEPHQPTCFIEEICQGFADGLTAARAAREELLTLAHERLADAESRFIFRDTDIYYAVVSEAMQAADYAQPRAFDNHIEKLRGGRIWPPEFSALIDSEIACVQRGDIPRFTLSMTCPSHVRAGGQEIAFRFAKSPGEIIKSHIQRDSDTEDTVEISTLRRTLEILDITPAQGLAMEGKYGTVSPGPPSDMLSYACELGDRLVADAVHHGTDIGWLAPVRVGGAAKYNYRPVPDGLYDGKLGIALFLAWLFRRSGRHSYIDCARRALASSSSISTLLDHASPKGSTANSASSEVLFTFAALTRLLGDPGYASNAARVIGSKAGPKPGSDLGILGGRAGEILARLALYEVTGAAEFVEDARRIASATTAPDWGSGVATVRTGLAHGEAGLGLALFKLWSATSDPTFLADAERCLARERSAWKEREASGTLHAMFRNRVGTELSWCNGFVGMLLLWRRLVGQDQTFEALEALTANASERRIAGNDSLCCGAFGHAGVLHLMHLQARGRSASPLVKLCSERTERDWALLGRPFAVQPPGLFSGLAGIGASFLAASVDDPELSILTFELTSSK